MISPNVYFLDHVQIKFTLFTVCTIKPTLLIVWTHRHYVAYRMVPLSLSCLHHGSINIRCLLYGFIKLTLFALQTNLSHVVYSMEPLNLRCLLHGSIQLTLFTSQTHQTHVVYSIDPLNLCCLQYEFINLMLITLWTQHSYIVYRMGPSNLHCLHYGIDKLTLLTVWPYPTRSTTR